MFYLVGSRFYGAHREDSDYDYIGANTPENHRACLELGLKKLDGRHTRYWGHGIDICLVSDLPKALTGRDELAKVPNVSQLSKAERHSKLQEIIRGL